MTEGPLSRSSVAKEGKQDVKALGAAVWGGANMQCLDCV